MRCTRGQASLEYVGLLALVVLVLSGTAAFVNWDLGGRLVWTIRTGLCIVAHTACPGPYHDRALLAPCPETRDASGQDFGVSVAFVALGAGLSVRRETFSDGHVELTFADVGHGGLTAGAGAGFRLGKKGGQAGVDGELNVGWTQGRLWRFRGRRAADAFLDRYGSDQKLVGRGLHIARRVCWLVCDAVGIGGVDDPPAPDERYDELGDHGSVAAELKWVAKADASFAADDALGWRRRRDGSGTLYLRVDRRAAGQLALLGAKATGLRSTTGTLEIDYDARHRPVSLRMRSGSVTGGGARVPGLVSAGGPPRLLEVVADLDLRGGDGARVVARFLHALRPDRLVTAPEEMDSVLRDARARSVLTARTYRVSEGAGGIGGHVALGAKLGGDVGHSHSSATLEGEWTRGPGSRWLPRADCRTA